MNKQDRVFTRTASGLERKYDMALLKKLDSKSGQQDIQLSELTQAFSQFVVSVNKQLEEMESKLFPIGSFYTSTEHTDPTEIFGGEWEFYAQGHLMIGMEQEEDEIPQLMQISDTCYVWKRLA